MPLDNESVVALAITKIYEELKGLREDMKESSKAISDISQRLAIIETHYQHANNHHNDMKEAIEEIHDLHASSACTPFMTLKEERKRDVKRIDDALEDHDERLKAIEEKPKKRMEVVVVEVIKATVVFILGAVAFKLGVPK